MDPTAAPTPNPTAPYCIGVAKCDESDAIKATFDAVFAESIMPSLFITPDPNVFTNSLTIGKFPLAYKDNPAPAKLTAPIVAIAGADTAIPPPIPSIFASVPPIIAPPAPPRPILLVSTVGIIVNPLSIAFCVSKSIPNPPAAPVDLELIYLHKMR